MVLVVYDEETGKYMTSEVHQLYKKLINLKSEGKTWEVIDVCVEAFEKKYPKHYKSYVIRLGELREAEKVTQVGRKWFKGISKADGTYTAHTVDFPAWIQGLIRKVFTTDELEFDREFFRRFANRYPQYRVMERVG